MLEVIVIPGHDRKDCGDYATTLDGERGISEYDFALKLARQVAYGQDMFTGSVLLRTPYGPPAHRDKRLLDQIAELKPKAIVELHFNTLNPRVFGPDKWQHRCASALYCPGREDSRSLAEFCVVPVQETLQLEHYKVQKQSRSWARSTKNDKGNWTPSGPELVVLTQTVPPAIILETHVGSDPDGHDRAMTALNNGALARAIATGIAQWLRSV